VSRTSFRLGLPPCSLYWIIKENGCFRLPPSFVFLFHWSFVGLLFHTYCLWKLHRNRWLLLLSQTLLHLVLLLLSDPSGCIGSITREFQIRVLFTLVDLKLLLKSSKNAVIKERTASAMLDIYSYFFEISSLCQKSMRIIKRLLSLASNIWPLEVNFRSLLTPYCIWFLLYIQISCEVN